MPTTLQANGRLRVIDASGATREIGPEHPDYQRFRAQFDAAAKPNPVRARIFGLVMILIGLAGWWYVWHQAMTEGKFSIKLTILGPLGVFGGLLILWRPEWAGPMRPNAPRAQKVAMFVVLGLILVASGINFYLLQNYHP